MSDIATVEADIGALDYKVRTVGAESINVGWDVTASATGTYYYGTTPAMDIAVSPDIENVVVDDLQPDIGAYEWTLTSAVEHS